MLREARGDEILRLKQFILRYSPCCVVLQTNWRKQEYRKRPAKAHLTFTAIDRCDEDGFPSIHNYEIIQR